MSHTQPSPTSSAFSTVATKLQRSLLALEITANPNITLAEQHISGQSDFATPKSNIRHTLFLMQAGRSHYGNAPATGDTDLDTRLLQGMVELARHYQFRVTEISGGSHSHNSRHYAGIAFDVDTINGIPVSARNPHVAGFMAMGRRLGATEVLGPGSPGHSGHVHLGWARPRVR